MVAAVAEVCIEPDILPWEKGHASAMISRCFDQWVVNRGGLKNLERDQALNRLRRFLVENGESGFTPIGVGEMGSPSDRVTVKRLGFRALGTGDNTDYYILPATFREIICAGLDPRQVVKHLIEANALVLDSSGKPQVTKRLPGLGTLKVYHVRSTVLAESEEASTLPVTQVGNG